MTNSPVRVERRISQRFAFNLPVSLRDLSASREALGFTQDVSSRGVFLFTDMPITAGAEVELTLSMPSEITLGESMRVRCKGRVLRVVSPPDTAPYQGPLPSSVATGQTREDRSTETKVGIAVCLSGYEHLSEFKAEPSHYRHPAEEVEGSAVPRP